jgi:hypothetical protein
MKYKIPLVLFIALAGCGKSLPEMKDVDLAQWKGDRNGCGGYRAANEAALLHTLPQLRGLKEMQLISMLGRPDENELYQRNQKYFYYWLRGAPACPDTAQAVRLSVRLNAMGYAKEVILEKMKP